MRRFNLDLVPNGNFNMMGVVGVDIKLKVKIPENKITWTGSMGGKETHTIFLQVVVMIYGRGGCHDLWERRYAFASPKF